MRFRRPFIYLEAYFEQNILTSYSLCAAVIYCSIRTLEETAQRWKSYFANPFSEGASGTRHGPPRILGICLCNQLYASAPFEPAFLHLEYCTIGLLWF